MLLALTCLVFVSKFVLCWNWLMGYLVCSMNVNLNNFVILVLCKCSMLLTYKIVTKNLETLD